MKLAFVETGDGSHTLYRPDINETYHSTHGAIAESKHVFIENGLLACNKNPIKILEIGFGTGLNALLSWMKCEEEKIEVTFHSIEKYPIPEDVVSSLNYPLNLDKEKYEALHQCKWNQEHALSDCFNFQKSEIDLLNFTSNQKFDVIYFDAFAPEKQPEMWSDEIFTNLKSFLNLGGFLVTYCAKGIIKRRLKGLGFNVKSLPGPPGKREMTVAINVTIT